MATWYQPRRLIELCELAVVERPGAEIDLAQVEGQLQGVSDRLHRVRMPRLQISSSDLRARRRAGRSIFYLVPSAVEAYIVEHGLYYRRRGLDILKEADIAWLFCWKNSAGPT